MRVALGRYRNCNIGFMWVRSKKKTLKTMKCPECGNLLSRTTTKFKGPWYALDEKIEEIKGIPIYPKSKNKKNKKTLT